MTLEVWISYVVACIILLIIPGPTVLMVSSYGISQGKRAVAVSALGVMLGSIIAITVALAGLGAIITTSAVLYDILKYAGAAYLIYLGVSMWRRKLAFQGKLSLFQISQVQIFRDTFLVSAFNPKDMLFFVAFLPQFIEYEASVFSQFVILGITFVVLGGLNTILWSSMAGGFRNMLTNSNVMGRINKVGGTGLFSAGIFTAISSRLN